MRNTKRGMTASVDVVSGEDSYEKPETMGRESTRGRPRCVVARQARCVAGTGPILHELLGENVSSMSMPRKALQEIAGGRPPPHRRTVGTLGGKSLKSSCAYVVMLRAAKRRGWFRLLRGHRIGQSARIYSVSLPPFLRPKSANGSAKIEGALR